jgi:chromosomal replication initiator protein
MIQHNKKIENKKGKFIKWHNDEDEFWRIFNVVSEYTKISKEDIQRGDGILGARKREFVSARHLISYFSYNTERITFKFIGENLGNRDHSTVIHGHQAVIDEMFVDAKFKIKVLEIEKILMDQLKE